MVRSEKGSDRKPDKWKLLNDKGAGVANADQQRILSIHETSSKGFWVTTHTFAYEYSL